MASSTTPPPSTPSASPDAPTSLPASRWRALALFLLPALMLALAVVLFVASGTSRAGVNPDASGATVQFERTVMRPGIIELHLHNAGPEDVTIAQMSINEAIWPYSISPGPTLAPQGDATMTLQYPWVPGAAYELSIYTSDGSSLETAIPSAAVTEIAPTWPFWSLMAFGIFVGILPVLIGMCWLPALRRAGPRALVFVLALLVGLFIYLGVDGARAALAATENPGGALQGIGLVTIGVVGTFVLLRAVRRRQADSLVSEAEQHLALTTMIALAVGLHSLGAGLAVGAPLSAGAVSLGTPLVVGVIIQNLIGGIGIVAPIVGDRPSLRTLALLGLLGGGPAVLGVLAGGLFAAQPLTVLLLAIGAGAVAYAAYELWRRVIPTEPATRQAPIMVFAGVLLGMVFLYAVGLVIA